MSAAEPRIGERTLRRLIRASAAFVAVGSSIGIALDIASARYADVAFGLVVLAFAVVGLVVLFRRPRETLGWLMLAMGLVGGIPVAAYGYYALTRDPPLRRGARTDPQWSLLGPVHRDLRLPAAAVPGGSPAVAEVALARLDLRDRAGAGTVVTGRVPVSPVDVWSGLEGSRGS